MYRLPSEITTMRFLCFLLICPSLVAQTSTGALQRFGSIRTADQFPGKTPGAQINEAIHDCGAYTGAAGNACVVIIPSGMACDEPHQAGDNVILWDFRGCGPGQGLRFNVPASVSRVRSKVLLQDNFGINITGLGPHNHSATLYVHSLPDNANQTTGSIAAINGTVNTNSLTGDFTGHLIGIEGEAGATLSQGGPFTVRDIRGGTFNTNVGKGINAIDVTSLFAQAPAIAPGGTIANAYSFRAEAPKGGTKSNLAGWFNGDVRIDTKLALGGPLTIGEGSSISKMVLVSSAITFPVILAQSCQERAIPMPGVTLTGAVSASPASGLGSNTLVWSGWISSVGNVSVRVCNVGAQSVTPRVISWNISVVQ